MSLKIFKKIRTASLNFNFTGSYKKKRVKVFLCSLEGQLYVTFQGLGYKTKSGHLSDFRSFLRVDDIVITIHVFYSKSLMGNQKKCQKYKF